MIPQRVWLRNVRTWGTLDLALPTGVCAIVGENGAGKSTVVNAIEWGLYAAGSRDLAALLTRDSGETELELGVEFDHMDERYRVRRGYSSRGGGKATFELEQLVVPQTMYVGTSTPVDEWTNLTRESMGKTQELLEQLLGMSRTTFRASCFLAQGDGAAFTAAGAAKRQEILGEVLGLGVYEQLREHVAGLRAVAEQRAARHLAEVEVGEGNMIGADTAASSFALAAQELEQAQQAVADVDAGLASARELLAAGLQARERAQATQVALVAAQQAQRAAGERVSALATSCGQAQERLANREGLQVQADRHDAYVALQEHVRYTAELRERYVQAKRAAADERVREREYTDQVDEGIEAVGRVEARRTALEAGDVVCPMCEQPLHGTALEAAKATVAAELATAEQARDGALGRAQARAEHATTLEADVERLLAEGAVAAAKQASDLEALGIADPAHLPGYVTAGAGAKVALAAHAEVAAQLERDRAALAVAEGERDTAAREVLRLEGDAEAVPDTRALEQAVAGAEALQRQASARVAAATGAHARAHEQVAAYARQAEVNKAAQVALTEARAEVQALKQDEQMYSRRGIPALILETSAIPHLELEATRYVAELGRPYRFELRTQRVGKTTATVQETLDIVVHTATGQALYEDFSGGERTRIDLALRIGLVSLLAARGAASGFLAVDEPMFLDEGGFTRLAAVLRGLGDAYERVLVVSHVPVLRDAFDAVLEVEGGADTGVPSRLVG